MGSSTPHPSRSSESSKPTGVWYRLNLDDIAERRSLLVGMWRHELENKLLTIELFQRLVAIGGEVLPAYVDGQSLHDSLFGLAGCVFTRPLIAETASRIAGNAHRLRSHRVVGSWSVQRFNEWVPAQITVAKPQRVGRKQQLGSLLTFRVLAGTPCPRLIERWWSLRQCQFLSRYFGFAGRRGGRYPYQKPEQLVSLRLYVLVEVVLSDREPVFKHTRFPASVRRWNHEQLKWRFRLDNGYECPYAQPQSLPCHHCPIGYQHCRAATHKLDYIVAACTACGRARAYFDAERPGACVACQNSSHSTKQQDQNER